MPIPDLDALERAHASLTRWPLSLSGSEIEALAYPDAPRGYRPVTTLASVGCEFGDDGARDLFSLLTAAPPRPHRPRASPS